MRSADGYADLTSSQLEEKLEQVNSKREEQTSMHLTKTDCVKCGPPVQDQELCLLALDVSALFPSMSAKRTGEIVRKRIQCSPVNPEGFDWRVGAVYIVMNKHLTSQIGDLWKVLPYRRKQKGTAPGMTSKSMKSKNGKLEEQWVHKTKEVTRSQKMEIIGRCAEIAIRTVFENFAYSFGGKIYLQLEGGPIGARLTMACARLVMQDWGLQYQDILKEAGHLITLFRIYVDDVRQISTVLEDGSRYDLASRKIIRTEEAAVEDRKRRQEGESADAKMVRILLPAMNSINPDLTFTTELAEDFADRRIPTLDFKMWLEDDLKINHTYFEKEMRSQQVIPRKSAIAERQKNSILSNEMNRRLSNVNVDAVKEEEMMAIIDHFTAQLRNSGYNRREAREIVVSGIKGWVRRHERRKVEGAGFYRSAGSTLKTRIKKKLLSKANWYKTNQSEQVEADKEESQSNGDGRGRKRKNPGKGDEEPASKVAKVSAVKAVMFCPYTEGGVLAKKLREAEEELESLTGYRMKIVERGGDKLLDLLQVANPWRGEDCGREGCWPCETKVWTEKDKKQDCTRRSVLYETWCETCAKVEEKKVDEEEADEQKRKEMKGKISKFKYIGESSRSSQERGREHLEGLRTMDPNNHLMKHVAIHHQGEKMEMIKFGMRVIKNSRSAFERQILESVIIQEETKKHKIMNSKSEYNRCSIPRLTAKMGNREIDKQRDEDLREEREENEIVMKEIYERRKEKCKDRAEETHPAEQLDRENRPYKKRKLEEDRYIKVLQKIPSRGKVMRESDQELKKKVEPPKKKVKSVRSEGEAPILYGETLPSNMEIWDIDWAEERKKRDDEMRKEEEIRNNRREKARKLEESWALLRECKKIIRENTGAWKDMNDKELFDREQREREDRIGRAAAKAGKWKGVKEREKNQVEITALLKTIPKSEAENLEQEDRKRERLEMVEVRENLWRKWRSRKDTKMMTEKIPTEEEKVRRKLEMIRGKVEKYKEDKRIEEEKKSKRLAKKKELEESWRMLRWLNKYLEENKHGWEKRKETQLRLMQEEEEAELWKKRTDQEKEDMMREQMMSKEQEEAARLTKAKQRSGLWKVWRKGEEKDNTEEEAEGGMDKVNTLPNEGIIPEGLIQSRPVLSTPKLERRKLMTRMMKNKTEQWMRSKKKQQSEGNPDQSIIQSEESAVASNLILVAKVNEQQEEREACDKKTPRPPRPQLDIPSRRDASPPGSITRTEEEMSAKTRLELYSACSMSLLREETEDVEYLEDYAPWCLDCEERECSCFLILLEKRLLVLELLDELVNKVCEGCQGEEAREALHLACPQGSHCAGEAGEEHQAPHVQQGEAVSEVPRQACPQGKLEEGAGDAQQDRGPHQVEGALEEHHHARHEHYPGDVEGGCDDQHGGAAGDEHQDLRRAAEVTQQAVHEGKARGTTSPPAIPPNIDTPTVIENEVRSEKRKCEKVRKINTIEKTPKVPPPTPQPPSLNPIFPRTVNPSPRPTPNTPPHEAPKTHTLTTNKTEPERENLKKKEIIKKKVKLNLVKLKVTENKKKETQQRKKHLPDKNQRKISDMIQFWKQKDEESSRNEDKENKKNMAEQKAEESSILETVKKVDSDDKVETNLTVEEVKVENESSKLMLKENYDNNVVNKENNVVKVDMKKESSTKEKESLMQKMIEIKRKFKEAPRNTKENTDRNKTPKIDEKKETNDKTHKIPKISVVKTPKRKKTSELDGSEKLKKVRTETSASQDLKEKEERRATQPNIKNMIFKINSTNSSNLGQGDRIQGVAGGPGRLNDSLGGGGGHVCESGTGRYACDSLQVLDAHAKMTQPTHLLGGVTSFCENASTDVLGNSAVKLLENNSVGQCALK